MSGWLFRASDGPWSSAAENMPPVLKVQNERFELVVERDDKLRKLYLRRPGGENYE